MRGREWKHNTFKMRKWEAILFALALPLIFIVGTFGAAISALFSKKS